MATQNLTTPATNTIYIHEKRSNYKKQKPSINFIDGIFTIPETIETLDLQDKLTERLNQLYAATHPPETPNSSINSDYLWMLQALIAEAKGITDELHTRWRATT